MEIKPISSFIKYREGRFSKVNVFKHGSANVFILNLMPGQNMHEHYHPGSQLFFLVEQGDGVFTINGENIAVSKGDFIHCLGTEKVGFTNTGDNAVNIYVTMCSLNQEACNETC